MQCKERRVGVSLEGAAASAEMLPETVKVATSVGQVLYVKPAGLAATAVCLHCGMARIFTRTLRYLCCHAVSFVSEMSHVPQRPCSRKHIVNAFQKRPG